MPNNSVLIREVSVGIREHYVHAFIVHVLAAKNCVPSRAVCSLCSNLGTPVQKFHVSYAVVKIIV